MRTLAFWEKCRTDVDTRLRQLHQQYREEGPRAAPRRRRRALDGRLSTAPHAWWVKLYDHWKLRNANRRELARKIAVLRLRVAYIDERIQAQKAKTAWATVIQGSLKIG